MAELFKREDFTKTGFTFPGLEMSLTSENIYFCPLKKTLSVFINISAGLNQMNHISLTSHCARRKTPRSNLEKQKTKL